MANKYHIGRDPSCFGNIYCGDQLILPNYGKGISDALLQLINDANQYAAIGANSPQLESTKDQPVESWVCQSCKHPIDRSPMGTAGMCEVCVPDNSGIRRLIKPTPERESGDRLTKDLAMLCKRLAFRLGRGKRPQADKDACRKAMDFLVRHNLQGSILRNKIQGNQP